MQIKDTKQASVRIAYDGSVHKRYQGPQARERYENELRVLRYLGQQDCPFVPRVLSHDPDAPSIVTTNCGSIVEKISREKLKSLFDELESYGVRHEDPFMRNVTYSARLGRFCLIDFEFATILETNEGLKVSDVDRPGREKELKHD